jgi:competence protein ComEA
MRFDALREFGYRLRLTRNEQNVLFFLFAAIIFGAGVTGFGAIFGPARAPGDSFSYDAQDREYLEGARQYAAAEGTPADSGTAASREVLPRLSEGRTKATAGRAVNINSASREELLLLPGVGPSTAEKILAYRTAHGAFRRPEEIMEVPSIGEKKFLKMKPYISVK